MKPSNVTALLALIAGVSVSIPAHAQTPAWAAIASNPVPSYQPFRGYAGSQTYIGNDYSSPRGGSAGAGEAISGGGDGSGGSPLHELAEDLELDCD